MKFLADLHTHSHFSRATSRDLIPEGMALWARKKGLTVLGTGDATHPGWVSELRGKLVEAENGLFSLRPELERAVAKQLPPACPGPVRFLLSAEISCIYKRDGKTRKAHHLVLLPGFSAVEGLNERLDRIGNITSDGRPILGLDSRDLLEIVLEVDARAFFVPAHIWTPWFSLFGSKSGFDSLEACFGDLTPHIHALETGLSSDPSMNRRLSALDGRLLISNSDAHSPSKLGREANLFDTALDYDRMVAAMISGTGFEGTVEFFPEEGKYHLDGHRKCDVRLHPRETVAHKGICPACGKPLTVGVLHRVYELSDRDRPKLTRPFYSLIPLAEILSEILACGPATKKVTAAYEALIASLGPELPLLLYTPREEIAAAGGELLARAIDRMRRNQVLREEGYDGEYGRIRLFDPAEKSEIAGQMALFERPALRKDKKVPAAGPLPARRNANSSSGGAASPSDPILDPLNDEQRQAVLHEGGHLLIVAGPGTGKTLTLTHRIARLVASGRNAPEEILALTFTNKAAAEMDERVTALLTREQAAGIRIGTFHAFCLDILRRESARIGFPSGFALCSELDRPGLVRRALSESGRAGKKTAALQRALPRLKRASVLEENIEELPKELPTLFAAYQEGLRAAGMLDLDDLEVETLRLFQEQPGICARYARRFPSLFVDEYQDTNPVQTALLKSLVRAGSRGLCAIGDPDQAIYGFRGADVGQFERFSTDFPGARVITLSRNYRSTQTILDAAGALTDNGIRLQGRRGTGGPLLLTACATASEEAEMVVEQIERLLGGTSHFSLDSGRVSSHEEGEDLGFGDLAVLFRLNRQGEAFEEAFCRAGIPFMRSGGDPLCGRYPADVLWRCLQVIHDPGNAHYRRSYSELNKKSPEETAKIIAGLDPGTLVTELIERCVERHGLEDLTEEGAETLGRLRRMARRFDGDLAAFLDHLAIERGIDHQGLSGDRVALMSLHAAKGLEWPVVFVTGCEAGLLPCTLFGDHDEAEERRLLYVGMTRAHSGLILSRAARRSLKGRSLPMKPSPYLSLIPGDLCRPLERRGWKRKKKTPRQLDLFG